MQKNLIVAGRGYGKTYKALQHLKFSGCVSVAVVCASHNQFNWIQSKISEDIYPQNRFIKTRDDMRVVDGEGNAIASYMFFSSLSPERLRGKAGKFNGLFLYDIGGWNQDNGIDLITQAYIATEDTGIVVATSLEKTSDMLRVLLKDKEYFCDTEGTRTDRRFLLCDNWGRAAGNLQDMTLLEMRDIYE